MNVYISDKKKKYISKILLFLLLIILLILPIYLYIKLCLTPPEENTPPQNDTEIEEQENEVEEVVEEDTADYGDPYEQLFPIIDEEQAYVVVPSRIDNQKPPRLIMYSHGSNTSVTQNMEDQFMKDLQEYGILFSSYNYIFAASNQHGVNWGSAASIQDTLNLKDWVEMNYPIQEKVYLIGFSMGGLPTLNFTTTYPQLVSKIALLAPTTKTSEWNQTRANKVKDIDIQIWHGNKDVNVPYSSVVNFVNSMEKWGIDIPLNTLEGKTHFDVDTEYMEDILQFFNRE